MVDVAGKEDMDVTTMDMVRVTEEEMEEDTEEDLVEDTEEEMEEDTEEVVKVKETACIVEASLIDHVMLIAIYLLINLFSSCTINIKIGLAVLCSNSKLYFGV